LRPRLRCRDWRRGVVVLVDHREIIRRLSCWVRWRGVLRVGHTTPLILGLFVLHEKLVFLLLIRMMTANNADGNSH
jgi:hypothetical protein